MTHAESQDLLLDLAYGELDPERAAEVRGHLEGCAECRKEKESLEEARRLAAPFRELEEPSPGFDDRIRKAARAQAQLEHDGNVGKVIEVAGTVRPLGVDAARIDAHGPVKARPAERHRPRWVLRVAVGGSVAAAAALAMVVGNTLETGRRARLAESARPEDYTIRVQQPASESVDAALRNGEAKKADADALRAKAEPAAAPARPSAALEKEKLAEVPARKRPRPAAAAGSGGDAPAKVAMKDSAGSRPAEADQRADKNAIAAQSSPSAQSAASAAARRPEAAPSAAAVEQKKGEVAIARPVEGGKVSGAVAPAASPRPAAGGIEADAQQARHAGNYALAASLYRSAAEMRRLENDPGAAAWNLAHAVECLSAVAQFDEARRVRDDLAKLYPSEAGALSAARRALREVDPAAR